MIQENVPLAGKTTMRIGGTAQFYAEVNNKDDLEAVWAFAAEHDVPLIVLGGGSNTIFADGVIHALVVRIKASATDVQSDSVVVEAGKNLPMLINELAQEGLDLSALTGILGTVGGAVFGNAGQGPKGVWIDSFIEGVTVFDEGSWHIWTKEDCDFSYRESRFKHGPEPSPIIWSVQLKVPQADPLDIQENIQKLLQRRIETQPHVKTAGSCFKAVGTTPAWQLIDAASLRGLHIGGVQVAEKHANFLLNTGDATFEDAVSTVEHVKKAVTEPLDVEMRFVQEDGSLRF